MLVLIDKPLPWRARLLVLRTSWGLWDFKNTLRVLLFGRTGPFPSAWKNKAGEDIVREVTGREAHAVLAVDRPANDKAREKTP
jgi:hypothetical protein